MPAQSLNGQGPAPCARSTKKPGLIAGFVIPADGSLGARVRIADIARIVDTTVAALIGALRAIVEIAIRLAAVMERAIAVALWTLSVTFRRARCDNAQGQAKSRDSEGSSHLKSPFDASPLTVVRWRCDP